ncbi:MAG: DUF1508 domain-containing protein [Bacteroidota bacterium]
MISVSKRWEFYKDNFQRWQWRKFQGEKVVAVSADGFDNRKACVLNAVQRGYDMTTAELSSTKANN